MIDWPESLVREIARRRCVFFLGAGVSASSTDAAGNRPKQWGEFLEAACNLISNPTKKDEIKKLISSRQYLLALQAIKQEADRADYNSLLNSNFNNPAYQPSDLHQIILNLDSRIVITTNFDKIYERLCLSTSAEGYKTIPYNSTSLGDELRSDTRIIIKAHGTIDDIQKMIFTKSEYHDAKKNNSNFYAMLRAIFLTHTAVFIGCSLDDPDVQLVLEEVRITASSEAPHYALVLKDQNNAYALADWRSAYNIRALEYEPDHTSLILDMQDLLARVTDLREKNSAG